MSHFSILRDATRELRAFLYEALTTVADVDFGFADMATDIILSAPDSDVPATARLSVYLYSIEPDSQLRNQRPLPIGTTGLVRAPLALRHQYLITPLQADEEQNHLILGRIMQALHDRPTIETLAGAPLDDSRGGGSRALRLNLQPLRLEDIARVWHAMGSDYRLSVAYEMRTVMIDSALDPVSADRVTESHILVDQGVGP
ncbi:Nitrogen regulation protein NR(I) [Rhodovulum sp. P5]|uniref:DUF4255 domain-containing protein n=1 Tax=Rhodovulum sp. P5 TaxID=1564506 RepID=UPI0009C25B6C|nr:DUF4255 domain-containing protein [Rhodovulum sp. P5]ARE41834.1 Nitrogen regulation protein NR(I) [Rhodovulum sp. P5]